MARGGGTPVAVTRENSVAALPGEHTKSGGNSTASSRIESVRHTKHPRRNHYSEEALLAINTVVAHYHTKEEALAPAM